MNPGTRPSPYSDIWEELVKIQRKTRLIALTRGLSPEEAGQSLNYTEGLILHIVETGPERNVGELAEILRLERSWVSRIVADLEAQKLLRAFVPESDKRSKKLRLSAKGRDALAALNLVRKELMKELLHDLSGAEVKELAVLAKALADGMHAPEHISIFDAHPVDNEFARISWQIGVIGDDYMHSGMNVTQYQIIYAITSSFPKQISASDLYEFLPFNMSTVTRTLAAFEKQGLIERQQDEADKRSFSVFLTARGQSRWKECQHLAEKTIAEALTSVSPSELRDFLTLLRKAAGKALVRPRLFSAEKIEVRPIISSDELKDTDRFLKEHAGISSPKLSQSGTKAARERYAVCLNNEIKGVIEVVRASETGRLKDLFLACSDINQRDCAQFLKACLEESGRKSQN